MERGRTVGLVMFVTTLTLSCLLVLAAPPQVHAVQRGQIAKSATPAKPAGATSMAGAPALAFTGVTVVDVESGRLIPGQTVVVVGTRVQAIGDTGSVRPPVGARVVAAKGKYLIPGLWDMHTHVQDDCHQDVAYTLFIANGVTGIRQLNLPSIEEALQVRRDIASGTLVGPRAVFSGPALDLETRAPDCRGRPTHWGVTTPDEARHVVDSLKAVGADLLKVYTELPRGALFALLAEARRVGIPVVGHLPNGVTAAEASDSGQRSIEHVFGSGLPPSCMGEEDSVATACTELAARFVRNGTWLTPTLSFYANGGQIPPDPDNLVQRLRALHQAGMPLLAGTDSGIWGEELHNELQMFTAGGMSPLDALRTATLNPAKYLNAIDSLGTVAPGKMADLVLLAANPLADIANTTTILAVVANGRYYDRAALNALATEGKRRLEADEREAAEREAAPQQGH